MLSISTSFVTYLHLHIIPCFFALDFATELAAVTEFPKFPALRHLRLDGFGISATAVRQMGCSGLRKLEVMVLQSPYHQQDPQSPHGIRSDGEYMLGCMMDVLNLPEVKSLDSVTVSFDSGEDDDQEENSPLDWTGTRESWTRLVRACAERNITCAIEHSAESS